MKCEKCGKNEATTYYKETINGQTREMHLCSECAKTLHITSPFEQAFAHMNSSMRSFFDTPFPSLFGGSDFFERAFTPMLSDNWSPFTVLQEPERRCPTCGTSLSDIRRTGKVGCPDCYHAFDDVLTPSIHQESTPAAQPAESKESVTQILQEKLQKAIELEDYEEAARLRDEIRKQSKAS